MDQNDRSVHFVNPGNPRFSIGQRGRPQNAPVPIEREQAVAGRLIQNGLRKHRSREKQIGSQVKFRIGVQKKQTEATRKDR